MATARFIKRKTGGIVEICYNSSKLLGNLRNTQPSLLRIHISAVQFYSKMQRWACGISLCLYGRPYQVTDGRSNLSLQVNFLNQSVMIFPALHTLNRQTELPGTCINNVIGIVAVRIASPNMLHIVLISIRIPSVFLCLFLWKFNCTSIAVTSILTFCPRYISRSIVISLKASLIRSMSTRLLTPAFPAYFISNEASLILWDAAMEQPIFFMLLLSTFRVFIYAISFPLSLFRAKQKGFQNTRNPM